MGNSTVMRVPSGRMTQIRAYRSLTASVSAGAPVCSGQKPEHWPSLSPNTVLFPPATGSLLPSHWRFP